MLISERLQIGFIHIPKCGGSTIRHQFVGLNDIDPPFDGVFNHPALGRVFLSHLPLWAIHDHFPDRFEQLCRFELFALLRDPFFRFESALSQFLTFHYGKRINDFSYGEVQGFANHILDHLHAKKRLADADYCHFIPQSAFVFHDGGRLVENLYTMACIEGLARDLSARTGIPNLEGFQANQTLDFRVKSSEGLVRRLSGYSRKMLPAGLHATAKRIAKKTLTRGGSRYKGFARRERTISEFIEGYYAQDIALFEEIRGLAYEEGARS